MESLPRMALSRRTAVTMIAVTVAGGTMLPQRLFAYQCQATLVALPSAVSAGLGPVRRGSTRLGTHGRRRPVSRRPDSAY